MYMQKRSNPHHRMAHTAHATITNVQLIRRGSSTHDWWKLRILEHRTNRVFSHVLGETDFLKPYGTALLESFVDPVVINHPKGHTVPRLGKNLNPPCPFSLVYTVFQPVLWRGRCFTVGHVCMYTTFFRDKKEGKNVPVFVDFIFITAGKSNLFGLIFHDFAEKAFLMRFTEWGETFRSILQKNGSMAF